MMRAVLLVPSPVLAIAGPIAVRRFSRLVATPCG
jgi:hypothetical protein